MVVFLYNLHEIPLYICLLVIADLCLDLTIFYLGRTIRTIKIIIIIFIIRILISGVADLQ